VDDLSFENVQAFKCTHLASLGTVDPTLRNSAYGTLISVEDSSWLGEVEGAYGDYYSTMRKSPKTLQHFMICFDDGPCFEVIGESWVVEATEPETGV